MSTKDIHTITYPVLAFNNAAISTDTTTYGNTINTEFYEALEFYFATTDYTDGTYTPVLEDSPDGTNWTPVTANWILGTNTANSLTGANQCSWLGYIGKQQYVRLGFTSTLVTSGASVVSIAVNCYPHFAPTDPNFVPVDSY